MENRFGCKFKSPISIALSFSLFFQPFLTPLAHAQTTSTTHSISYDTNGNMTQDENGNTYEYDAENKLISFIKGDGNLKTEYTYYADGSRKSKQITLKENGKPKPLNPIHFYYDHAKNQNVVNETQIFNGKTVTSSYLMANDTRYARYLSDYPSDAKYYLKNHKDTTMMVGEKGANPTSHSYTPYGEERTAKATNTIIAEEIKFSIISNPFLYSSQYTDAESGLQYLRARYYKADHMRFISRDTNSKPRNKYAYANGNPIMEDDPSGMMADWIKNSLSSVVSFLGSKEFISTLAGVGVGAFLGVFTGGAGFAATIAAGVVEGAAGATAQVGVSRLWDKESFFTKDTLKEIGINTAIAGGLALGSGVVAGKIMGSEKFASIRSTITGSETTPYKPLFGEGKVFERLGNKPAARAFHEDAGWGSETPYRATTSSVRTENKPGFFQRIFGQNNKTPEYSATPKTPRSETHAPAPREDYSSIGNQRGPADAVDPEACCCLLEGICRIVSALVQ